MDSWDGEGWYTCMLVWYTGLLHRHAGLYTWMFPGCGMQRWHMGTLGQYTEGTESWWDGTLQDSVNKEAKWILESTLLLALLKLTPLLVSVVEGAGFAFISLIELCSCIQCRLWEQTAQYQGLVPPVWVV